MTIGWFQTLNHIPTVMIVVFRELQITNYVKMKCVCVYPLYIYLPDTMDLISWRV